MLVGAFGRFGLLEEFLELVEGEGAFEPAAGDLSASQDGAPDFGNFAVWGEEADLSAVAEWEALTGDEADAAWVGIAGVEFPGSGGGGIREESKACGAPVGTARQGSAIAGDATAGGIEGGDHQVDFGWPATEIGVGTEALACPLKVCDGWHMGAPRQFSASKLTRDPFKACRIPMSCIGTESPHINANKGLEWVFYGTPIAI